MTQAPGDTGAMKKHSRGRAGLSIALVSLALVAIDAPRAVAAGGSCSLDPDTHVATVSPFGANGGRSDLTIIRRGDDVMMNGTVCGTVTTIDKMVLNLGDARVGVTFDLRGGPFEPGYVSQSSDDSGEMEFEVNFTDDLGPIIEIVGTGDDDFIKIGEDLDLIDDGDGDDPDVFSEVNLNAATDQDADIWVGGRVRIYDIEAFSGNDHIDGRGLGGDGPFDLSGPTTGAMRVHDGAGNDTITGGRGDDYFYTNSIRDGEDTYVGGVGHDRVDYRERTSSLMVTFDGVANDGQDCPGDSCERDNIGSDIDVLVGGSGSDTLVGGPGPQFLHGGEGHNLLRGLGGNDLLSGGSGNDDFRGGGGFDTVFRSWNSWSSTDHGITVTIDDKPGDGAPGEQDNVHTDVEGLLGTPGKDVLIGSGKDNKLYGGGSDDVLKGGPGNDILNGGRDQSPNYTDGDDEYFGGSGRDTVQFDLPPLLASEGLTVSLDDVANDRATDKLLLGVDNVHSDVENVVGSAGPDILVGSAANNRLVGKAGSDTLKGLGGNDTLLGGPDDDTLLGGRGTDSCKQGDGTGTIKGCE